MLHHLSLPVKDLKASAALYDAALGALGYIRAWSFDSTIGYGLEPEKDRFAIRQRQNFQALGDGFHLAFSAPSQAAVRAFHAAALENGAQDNGAPGLRPQYGPDYYAAFVIDLDGHRLEAVCKNPQA